MKLKGKAAVTRQPQGARSKDNVHPSSKPPPLRARALPAVPPTIAHAHTVQNARRPRPLPYCPSLNSQVSSSASSSSSSFPSSSSVPSPPSSSFSSSSSPSLPPPPPPSSPVSPSLSSLSPPPSPALFASPIMFTGIDDPSFDIGPIEFLRPKSGYYDSDTDWISEDNEDADIMEPYQRIKNNKSTNHRWKIVWRPTEDPSTKWVEEIKGQRMTVKDFNNIRNILRNL